MATFCPRTCPLPLSDNLQHCATLRPGTYYPNNLTINYLQFNNLAAYDRFITFLQAQRPAVKDFFTKSTWTAEELLAALKQAYPDGLIFHPRNLSLSETLSGDCRFYIVNNLDNIFFSYGHCCRRQRKLDCPPEQVYNIFSLLRNPDLTSTKL